MKRMNVNSEYMKKIVVFLLLACAFACTGKKAEVEIIVHNFSSLDRENEIVEMDTAVIGAFQGEGFVLCDSAGRQIPYQVTYDGKVIFPASVKAGGNAKYRITAGNPEVFDTIACGKQYPERLDDIAWENDRIAFRTYGPALQATGEKAYGYDIWVKRVAEPVVDMRYRLELNPETRAQIAELRKSDPEAASKLANSVSYHIDHGNGLDYYNVGPTLGAGTSALVANGKIVYPYCYKDYEILDNGPLRFTVKLVYNPLDIPGEGLVEETRVISLDAGSQLNRIAVRFDSLRQEMPVVTGIVMHAPSEVCQMDTAARYIAYAEPEVSTDGQIYVAVVFPKAIKEAKIVKFSEKEQAERKALGHVAAFSMYRPGDVYTYYSGAGWSKWGFDSPEEWFDYVQHYAQRLRTPLKLTIRY